MTDLQTAQSIIEDIINKTPSGDIRNCLTNANIFIMRAIENMFSSDEMKQAKKSAYENGYNDGYSEGNSDGIRETQENQG